MGAKAYTLLDKHADALAYGMAVEIGSDRNEGSTEYIARVCKLREMPFLTIDYDPSQWERAKAMVGPSAVLGKGEDVLQTVARFPRPLSFVYFDNFDWMHVTRELNRIEDILWIPQAEYYDNLGEEMNNLNSQMAHLRQAILAEKLAGYPALFLFDDTYRTNERVFSGKGGAAIPYLIAKGFKILWETPLETIPECGAVALAKGL